MLKPLKRYQRPDEVRILCTELGEGFCYPTYSPYDGCTSCYEVSENGDQSDQYKQCYNNTEAEYVSETKKCPTGCQTKTTSILTSLIDKSEQSDTSSWDIAERGCAEANQVEEYEISSSSFYCEEQKCDYDESLLSDVLFCIPEPTTTTPVITTVG